MTPSFVGRLGGGVAILAMTLALALSSPVAAQQSATGTIRGLITDAVTGRPLPNGQVSLEGTSQGAMADARGAFQILRVPAGVYTMHLDLIGYAAPDQEVTVVAGQIVTVAILVNQVALQLDELVVTGTAGATQRRAIGNSIAKIEAAAVTASMPVGSVQDLLQARTPGLSIMSNGGGAGDGSQIRLRGSGSLEGQFQPVVYVDGIRFMSQNNSGGGQCGSTLHCSSALDQINPNDIESIEVIRGPAAATLYGADAASGVIQIITKKGAAGTGVQFSGGFDLGITDWTLNRPTTYWLCREGDASSSSLPGCAGIPVNTLLTDTPLDRHPNALRGNKDVAGCADDPTNLSLCAMDPNGANNGSWNLSARGGGQNFNYYLSVEQSDEQGIMLNNRFRRNGGRANFGFTPSEALNINVNVGYVRTHINQPQSNNSSNSILRNGFRGRAGAAADPWEFGFRGFGPVLSNEWDQQTRGERTTIGITANYNPFPWLQNRLVVGMDNNDLNVADRTEIDQTGRRPKGTSRSSGWVDITLPNTHTWTLDYSGTITVDINENYGSAFSAGVQLNATKFNSYGTRGEGLVANSLNLVSSAATTTASQRFSEQTSLGFFVQEQVSFKDKLYITAAIRVDDNSAFGKDFSLVTYPKAQVSYVISDEDFFDVGFIDQLKLRGAWGQAGSPPDPFSADRTYRAAIGVVGDEIVNILTPASFGNPDLKAETGSELEVGFEASLYDGRVGVDFTYYNQTTKDALVAVPNPPSSGFSGSHLANVGEISNTGFEILVTATPVYTRTLQWDVTASIGTNNNKLVSWGDAPLEEISFGSFAQTQKHIPGYPMGGFWSTDVVRNADGSPVLTGSGGVTVESAANKEYVGPARPTKEIAVTNTLTLFDNFRIYANLDYKGGNYQWCAICSIRSRVDRNGFLLNNVDADPVDVTVARSLQTKTHITTADFVKLRELAITYQLPLGLTQAASLSQASISFSARNLWMWTNYEFPKNGDGFGSEDPEVKFSSTSAYRVLDYASIPMLRTYSLAFRFSF